MKKLLFILFSFVLFTSSTLVVSDQSEEASARIKTIYIYNFTKYIEWPDGYNKGNFVIGYLGSSNVIFNELVKMAEKKKTIGSQIIEIQNMSSADEAAKCNIIYIATDNSSKLSEVLGKVKSTLIVTDKEGLAKKGAGINFVVMDNKQKIELNLSNIEKYKLKVSTTLLDMAVQVK